MPAEKIQFIALDKRQYPLVNKFYKHVYKKGIACKDESVFVLKDKTIVCSARLKTVAGQLLLTGVASAPEVRGKGYAAHLIKQILVQQSTTIYCFPYRYLVDFYSQLGFVQQQADQAPAAIQKQFARYNHKNTLLLMCYPVN
ncbi:MAG: N-acetylglutamate synthase-like GNAT family acetyltransferase [Psychromonas sp.]|jgi:N-acetylglutamate synthase-like GNAT family acetyltransferase|uniref:GNAT family N-acetyltransferase n=1 Tax=Psychromonas sp. TaxID=1884585 RepID=UPI0039E41CF1